MTTTEKIANAKKRIDELERLIKYWRGTLLVPHRQLIVGRLNKVIAGTLQLVFQPPNNEAQQNITNIIIAQLGGAARPGLNILFHSNISLNNKSQKFFFSL